MGRLTTSCSCAVVPNGVFDVFVVVGVLLLKEAKKSGTARAI